jgi:hypothetical protein
MLQVARNLTDCEDGFLKGKRLLIHDRDPRIVCTDNASGTSGAGPPVMFLWLGTSYFSRLVSCQDDAEAFFEMRDVDSSDR